VVAGNLVDLLTSQQNPENILLGLVLQDLDVANSTFFPLLGVCVIPTNKLRRKMCE
jgi:hypothetical protein